MVAASTATGPEGAPLAGIRNRSARESVACWIAPLLQAMLKTTDVLSASFFNRR
jgi:hypothetical protein